ncbi:hypothetical protein BYT27DRAFT_7189848 [Phlegmacium glaucopus]|nr:hypothetical protein BYT27DRAFT_7189848 [Phlegmacium glaucopus]
MSRYPTRRRSPSVTNGVSYISSTASSTSAVRPLQISRPESRPTTPVNTITSTSPSYPPPPNTVPLGPSRPQRSELRARAEYSESERTSISSDPYKDSASTRSDSTPYRIAPNSANNMNAITGSRSKPQRLETNGDQITHAPLNPASSASQSAGPRKGQNPDEVDDYNYQRERELEIEAERARQQWIRDKGLGLRTKGNARRGEIDAVLDQVKDGWEFVIDPDFNNVDLALQLLDQSSLGKDIDSFRRTKDTLSKALKGSVDKHYQAFAASLPHHTSLLGHLRAAQVEISGARVALLEAKECLGGKRADLVQLWNRGQMLEEMIKILDQIEHLKTVPDLLETLMSEKRLLQASILLIRSLKIINNPDMLEIGAVADLRSYLDSQEVALREILIDELQNHLYLKSFWCESRWSAYVPNQQSLPKTEIGAEPAAQRPGDPQPPPPSLQLTRLIRFLNNLELRPNDPPCDLSDTTHGRPSLNNTSGSSLNNSSTAAVYLSSSLNPEADSFTYMETLLESLAVLGKLGNALDNIAQRLPGEIFALVETTLDEVEERVEYGRRRSSFALISGLGKSEGVYTFNTCHASVDSTVGTKTPLMKSSSLRLSALESLATRVDHDILKDLFWTLYSKLDAVAQGLRVVTEVTTRIGSRRDYKDSSGTKPVTLFPLPEIWSHIQTEVRTLIQTYLTDEQQGSSSSRNPISSINEILRDGKFNRDRNKPVFRFSDTDMKITNKALRPHEDSLTRVLKDTMPGLAPNAGGDTSQTVVTSATDERLLGIDQQHRLLIRPDAFHVTVLFQPTLSFLQRVSETLPTGVESPQTSSVVLDQFVLNVYLPRLEEKVSDLFHEAVTGPEMFQPDPLSWRLSPQPLAKASTHLMALINSLCVMLRRSPFHRENYSRLILGVVIQFYQRCSDRFQALTTTPAVNGDQEAQVALAAQWAQRSELQTCLIELMSMKEPNGPRQQELYRQETRIEMDFLGQKKISKVDLMSSTRNLAALASLHRSVSWFSAELNALRDRTQDTLSTMTPNNLEPLTGFTPSTSYMPSLPSESLLESLSLPLSREMALRFQALLKTYDQLGTVILDTIRIDLRCRTMHYLDAALNHGNYDSNYEAAEPDPHVVDLNTELVQCHESMSIRLPPKDQQYVFYVFPSAHSSERKTNHVLDIYSVGSVLSWNTYLSRAQVVCDCQISLELRRCCATS